MVVHVQCSIGLSQRNPIQRHVSFPPPGGLKREHGMLPLPPNMLPGRGTTSSGADVLEWFPQLRTQPTVCVVSVVTSDLLADWGGVVVESNANWAMAHGYRYTVFTRLLTPPTLHPVWSNPRALQRTLLQGEDECARAFYLDGDALVIGVERSLGPLLTRFLTPPVHIVFSCHSPLAGMHALVSPLVLPAPPAFCPLHASQTLPPLRLFCPLHRRARWLPRPA